MDQIPVIFRLDQQSFTALRALADGERRDIGSLLREAVRRDLRHRAAAGRAGPAPDAGLPAGLRGAMDMAVTNANTWGELESWLHAAGFELHEEGPDLAVHETALGTRVCGLSRLGRSYRGLMRRFRGRLPSREGFDALSRPGNG